MGYIIIAIFVLTIFLSLLEEHIQKYRPTLYIILAVVLILLAGLREVGIDPDSENYEYTFLHYYNAQALEQVEFSYLFFSKVINSFTNDVHVLFLLYAIFGVGLKFLALRKYSKLWFLPISVYLSYYFVQHECMQMRTGVLSGIMLFIIMKIADGERLQALVLMVIGTLFHYSALLLLPFFFLSNKEMSSKQITIWALVIPVAYVFHFAGFSLFISGIADVPLIGAKLAKYQEITIKGTGQFGINAFSPLQLLTVTLYYYLLIFHKTITQENKYYPLLMKVFSLGIFSYVAFSFFPAVAQRINMLFQLVNIILYANIYYTIKPRWAAISVVMLIGLIYLNYSLPNVGTVLFWKV
ncbi:MAG: EpsG family protein [Prevotella sp.]|jgi:hypothetical protein